MHKPAYIKIIEEAAERLDITVRHFSNNWAINLSKSGTTKFITGCTFPLNDSSTYKIARNKNICSDVLNECAIPNVPHQLIFSPTILNIRKNGDGNLNFINHFINENKFPFLIKKNNSSKGDGVFKINNFTELEDILSKTYITDNVLCLSPFRIVRHEYRNIVLNGTCLLSYEKLRPSIVGDGNKTAIELLIHFYGIHNLSHNSYELFSELMSSGTANAALGRGEEIALQWKHNTSPGSSCKVSDIEDVKSLAIKSARAINAKFVAVDIIYSLEFGYEVLEINASVVLNLFSSISDDYHHIAVDVFEEAIKSVFELPFGII
jgi:glutathione synthase/RimK-type ligase-like ATP-grasp enzyme